MDYSKWGDYGDFITECGYEIQIKKAPGGSNMYSQHDRIIITPSKVTSSGEKRVGSKKLYYTSVVELSSKLQKYFGYLPKIAEPDGVESSINGNRLELIDLVYDILEEGGEYNARNLVNSLIRKFYNKLEIFSEEQIEQKINAVHLQGLNNINFYDVGDESSEVEYIFHLIWPDLRRELDRHNKIVFRGEKRGRMYRHKNTRPRLSDKFVAYWICQELDGLEIGISKEAIYDMHIKRDLKAFHHFIEIGEEKHRQSQLGYSISSVWYRRWDNDDEIKNLDSSYRIIYDGKFREWADKTYSRQWFWESWGNINKEMRGYGARSGEKRGTWMVTTTPLRKTDWERTTKKILEMKKRFEREAIRLCEDSEDELDAMSMAILTLNTMMRSLNDKEKKLRLDSERGKYSTPRAYKETVWDD